MCRVAVDPYGNCILIPEQIIPYAELASHPEISDTPERVIQQPAIMLTSCKEALPETAESCENHYLRLINSDTTLLISARRVDGKWMAYRCLCNPSTKQVAILLETMRQLK